MQKKSKCTNDVRNGTNHMMSVYNESMNYETKIQYTSLKPSMATVIKNKVKNNNTKQKWITTSHSKVQMLIDQCVI